MRMRRLILPVLAGLVASVGLFEATAQARISHILSGSFGPFENVQGIAVDESNGGVYVFDSGQGGTIGKFNGAGEPAEFTTLKSNTIANAGAGGFIENQLAVDNSSSAGKGDIYLANANHVAIYAPDGTTGGELNGEIEGPWGTPCGVAVDGSGDVYVGLYPEHVNEYRAPTSGHVTNADYLASMNGLTGVCNLTTDGQGNVYTSAWPSGPVLRFAPEAFGQTQAEGTLIDSTGGTLAADLTSDTLYVNETGQIVVYAQDGTRTDAFGNLSGSAGVAVDDTTNTIYASDPSKGNTVGVFAPAVFPDASLQSPLDLATTSATLTGTVNPNGVAVTACEFQYGTSPSALNRSATCASSPGGGISPVGVSAQISGLNPNETYYLKLVTANANGQTVSTGQFATLPALPVIDDSGTNASSVERRGALLSGATVDPRNSATTCYFVFGISTAYGHTARPTEMTPGLESLPVAGVGIQQLQPDTVYHYALVATNQAGTIVGADHTFTTALASPPQVGEPSVSELAPGSATVSGPVESNGLTTTYEIDLGVDTSYGTSTSGEVLGAGQTVSMTLLYLKPSTLYHYRLIASNEDGAATSGDRTFTTPAYMILLPQVLPQVAAPAIAFPAEGKTAKAKSKPMAAKHKGKKHKKSKHKKKK